MYFAFKRADFSHKITANLISRRYSRDIDIFRIVRHLDVIKCTCLLYEVSSACPMSMIKSHVAGDGFVPELDSSLGRKGSDVDGGEPRCDKKSWLMRLRADRYVIDIQKPSSCIGCVSRYQ